MNLDDNDLLGAMEEQLRQIRNLPDTEGGGMSAERTSRNVLFELAYARRDAYNKVLAEASLGLRLAEDDIARLGDEEKTEMERS
jgi:hypothetical protein